MDAAPMVRRCLELQNDNLAAPFLPTLIEIIPEPYRLAWPVSEHCDRCGVNHGSGTVYQDPAAPVVYEYPATPQP